MESMKAGSPIASMQPEDWMLEERFGTKRAEEKAAAGKKTKVVRVKQGYIDYLLAHPPKPFRGVPQEDLDRDAQRNGGNPNLRDIIMRVTASVNKEIDEQEAILQQYRLKGYAEQEIEIDDDDVELGN